MRKICGYAASECSLQGTAFWADIYRVQKNSFLTAGAAEQQYHLPKNNLIQISWRSKWLYWGSGFVLLNIIVVDHDFLRVRNCCWNRSQWLPVELRRLPLWTTVAWKRTCRCAENHQSGFSVFRRPMSGEDPSRPVAMSWRKKGLRLRRPWRSPCCSIDCGQSCERNIEGDESWNAGKTNELRKRGRGTNER